MVLVRVSSDGRSLICFRKYRIFFIFGAITLCAQIYLAYMFFAMEHEGQGPTKRVPDESPFAQSQEGEGLPVGTRQLKLPPDKYGNNKSLQVHRNRSIRLKLDNKSLNFTPACQVTSREAVSAITRAQTQFCKQSIVNVTCLSQLGLLYPVKLQSSCPQSQGFKDTPKNLGCFKDDKILRTLSGYYTVFKGNNSPIHCANICLQSGFPYAGVEYSIECFCGIEEPSELKRLPDSSCNMKCPGDSKQSCGGYLTINVLSTGIQRFKAKEAKNSSLGSVDERPARIAYLLTVNGRASRQVKRLISTLYHPSHLFYIHVDARQDYLYREMLQIERSCKTKNVIVAKGNLRHASIWGGASLLTTLLTSARQMLAYDNHWDFLINLSESDFPVKTNERLTEFLAWNRGLNFVKSHGREVQRFISKQGLDKTFVECEARMWRVGDRKLPIGIQIDGGSDWVALSRDFVEYVSNPNPDSLVSGLLKFFKYTLLPAESFFHTVLRNSRFCDTYVDNNLHVTNWKRKLGCKCQYKVIVDWCGCSPNDFKLEDFGRIRNTAERNLFFARKFEPVVDQQIIDRVEQWLYPKKTNASLNIKGHAMYWQSLYHFADLSPRSDDVLLTISDSFARLTYHKLGATNGDVRVLETHAYFRENSFFGTLIRCKTKIEPFESSTAPQEFPEDVESLVHNKHHFSTRKSWLGKIVAFSVNTDYDQKEQIFRNFVGGIGPLSVPILAYEFDQTLNTPQNVTILWIDPFDHLADINHLQLEDMSLIGHVRPQLNEKLVIGTWRVLLIANSEVVTKSLFLVTPLAYWEKEKITLEKVRELHSGEPGPYRNVKTENAKWSPFLKSTGLKQQVNMRQKLDAKYKTGVELHRMIDTLVSEHYEIKEICHASEKIKSKPILQKCYATDWSSLSPDSKSDVRNLCKN